MRRPTHPGEILNHEFLAPLGVTQQAFATHVGCDVKTINRLVRGHSGVTTRLAVRLGRALRTSPEFWLNLQSVYDLYEERSSGGEVCGPLEALGT